jgi:hypothetical protein
MKKVQRGIAEAMVGIVLGVVLTTVVDSFVKNGTLPSYSVWLLGLFNIVGNLMTIDDLRYGGTLYTIGWLIGSWLLRSMMGPVDIAFNIAGPIVILLLRGWFWYKSLQRT